MAAEENARAIERAVSLIRKAEAKSVPRHKIQGFLQRKDLNEEEIGLAFQRYFSLENLVEIHLPSKPLGFSVVTDSAGNNCVVSSIQHESLEQQGLEPFSRIVKVADKYVEGKKHQDVIDVILDNPPPVVITFRKRKHKKRGSLFEKVARPVKSLPATRSAGCRGSMIVGGNSTLSRGSTINPELMNTASRGSSTDVTGGAEAPADSDEETQNGTIQRVNTRQPTDTAGGSIASAGGSIASSGRRNSKDLSTVKEKEAHSHLFRGNDIHAWEEEELDEEEAAMKKMMVSMMAQTTSKKGMAKEETEKNIHMEHLSRKTKVFLHTVSTKGSDLTGDGEDDYIKDLMDVWNTFDDDDDVSEMSEAINEEAEVFTAQVRAEAANIRQTAKDESRVNFDEMEPLTFEDGSKVPSRARMNSAPVYSTDAMQEMIKGTSLMKYGKRGAPKFRHFQLSEDRECLIWFSKKKNLSDSRILIGEMHEVVPNVKHERKANEELVHTSFAILYGDGQNLRLTAKNATEAHIWVEGLNVLIKKAQNNIPLDTIHHIPLQKQPGLDMHRRGSLAQLLDARVGTNSMYRQKNVDKIRIELRTIRKNYKATEQIINSAQFDVAMATKKRKIEKERIVDRLVELQSRLNSVENQAEASLESPVFDMEGIKTDVWNVSVDLLSFKCKLEVLCTQTTEL